MCFEFQHVFKAAEWYTCIPKLPVLMSNMIHWRLENFSFVGVKHPPEQNEVKSIGSDSWQTEDFFFLLDFYSNINVESWVITENSKVTHFSTLKPGFESPSECRSS